MSVLVGLDVGTSGACAVAVDEEGKVVAEASAEYPLHSPRPGWTEQDPEDWWRGAKEVLGKVTVGVDDLTYPCPASCPPLPVRRPRDEGMMPPRPSSGYPTKARPPRCLEGGCSQKSVCEGVRKALRDVVAGSADHNP